MKEINRARLPYFWKDMSFVARAAWLCAAKMADNFSEAASMLARQPRRPKATPPAKKYYWQDQD